MTTPPQFDLQLACSADDIRAAQRLRYQVFVAELGGSGDGLDHAAGLEHDKYDAHADHLLLRDLTRPKTDQVVGVYRMMTHAQAQKAGGFSSGAEYDLTPLCRAGAPVMELGRSCLHPDYRGGAGMYALWQGLADHVRATGTKFLFGVASFHGIDPEPVAQALGHLHYRYRAPAAMRPIARSTGFVAMDTLPEDAIDYKAAIVQMPALIKAYLRLGGRVGEGAFRDKAFNTIDVCMVVAVDKIPAAQRARYSDSTQ